MHSPDLLPVRRCQGSIPYCAAWVSARQIFPDTIFDSGGQNSAVTVAFSRIYESRVRFQQSCGQLKIEILTFLKLGTKTKSLDFLDSLGIDARW
jgi:hypothetical protein